MVGGNLLKSIIWYFSGNKYKGRNILNKTNLIPQIGINPRIYKNNKKKRYKNIIFVGRFLYWKGMKIGLEAFQKALQKDLNLRLTMVGSGPEFKYWFKIAQDLKINSLRGNFKQLNEFILN